MKLSVKKLILLISIIGIIICVVLAIVFIAKEKNIFRKRPNDAKDKGFKVVGYYPDWEPQKLDRIQFDTITHINYAFAIPTDDGKILPFKDPKFAKELIKLAHKNNVKVLLAVGGWSYLDIPLESTFANATKTDLEGFAEEILKCVKAYGFDGIDMDWEHPRFNSGTGTRYEKLMLYLSKRCKQEKLLLTSAVISGVDSTGSILQDSYAHSDAVLKSVDWINVMAYDGGDGELHSQYNFAVNASEYWINKRGVPKEKVVVGVPFYARPTWSSYDEMLKVNPDAHSQDSIMMSGKQSFYNGLNTIKKKTNWAKQNCGGIMIWEVSQDTTDKQKSLLAAIGETLK